MERKRRIFVFLAIVGGFFYLGNPAQAAHSDHLLISEVQITGGAGQTANDFVEIYNPTGASVDLNGVRLVKRSKTGAGDTTIKSWITETLVPAHGFYLWANSGFAGIGVVPDAMTSETIAADNAVALRRGPENTGEIIDAAAWGGAENVLVEGAAFAQNPGAGESIERLPGATEGNSTDTNNNAADFVLRAAADPQNSASAARPEIVAPAPSPPPSPTEGEGDGGDDGGGGEGEGDISESPLPAGEGQGEGQEDHNSPQPPLKLRGGEVVINEFVPDPLEGSEWIELYNTTNAAIELTGFEIRDGTGNAIAALSGEIAGRGFFVVELTRARLNNGGDVIELYGPRPPLTPPLTGGESDWMLIDRVSYGNWDDGNEDDNAPAAEKGQSVARKSNGADTDNDANDFSISEEPTRGASNVIRITETITETITQGGTNVFSAPAVIPKPLIVINEFVSDPEDGPEWVEVYNSGTVAVDLEGWSIEEGAERKTKLPVYTLVPGAWYVVEEIKGNLNNKGDIIRLKNPKDEIADWVSYGTWEDGKPSDNAPVADDPHSVARVRDGADTDNDKKDFAVTSAVTKGGRNIIEAPKETEAPKVADNSPQPPLKLRGGDGGVISRGKASGAEALPPNVETVDKLFISEFLPNPVGSDSAEWIEIFWGGDVELRLDGFQLDDGEGGSRPYTFDDKRLGPHAYLLVPKSESRLTLNNVSDAVRLFDPRGRLIDSVEYEEVKEGQSYARDEEGEWGWTATSTPGTGNVIDSPSPPPSPAGRGGFDTSPLPQGEGRVRAGKGIFDVTLAEIRELPLGTRVRTQGVVSVLPGVLGTQYFYIAGSGAQVYMFKKDFPPLALGDLVQVEGELSETGGERRIKASVQNDIRVLRRGEPPLPVEISADMVSEDLEGNVVEIAGTIIEAGRSGIIIDDGMAEATVTIKSSTAIDTRDLVPGLQVRIAGIVGQTRSGYRVLPRTQEDIEVLGVDELAIEEPAHPDRDRDQSGKSSPYAKATALAFGGAALAALGIRRRRMFTGGARAVWFILRRGK